jgi:serine/threonine protein kinase
MFFSLEGSKRRLSDDYFVTKTLLGRGHFGKVFIAIDKITHEEVAVKVILKSRHRKRILDEIEVLQYCQSQSSFKIEGMVHLLAAYEDENAISLVFPKMGVELFAVLSRDGPLTEPVAKAIAFNLIVTIAELHSIGVVHRDIKPENLLFGFSSVKHSKSPIVDFSIPENNRVFLCDLGLAKKVDLSKDFDPQEACLITVAGTLSYSAPEMRDNQRYSASVDIWSLGIVLYTMLVAFHPFDPYGRASDNEILTRIKTGKFDFRDPAWAAISSEAKHLISQCLQLRPSDRPTAMALLNHSWFKTHTPSTIATTQSEILPPSFRKHVFARHT